MTLQDYILIFPGASREKPKFMALSQAVLRQVADLLPVTSALISGFSLGAAVGVQLDQIAEGWGLKRADTAYGSGATDEQFRAFLTAKLAQWQWDGTNAGVDAALAAIPEATKQVDNLDGTVTVTLTGSLPAGRKAVLPVPMGVTVSV